MQAHEIESVLDALIGSRTPGLQYLALNSEGPIFQYNAGQADIQRQRPMVASTTLNAYSMSKAITAAAVLLLVQSRTIRLDEPLARYVRLTPYSPLITIQQLLSHTSGIPNPIPLRWVHPISAHKDFNEVAALNAVLRKNPRLSSEPGSKFAYSNIGYWLLGEVVAKVTGGPFTAFVSEHVIRPLGIPVQDLLFCIPDLDSHAQGYLEKYCVTNLVKGFLIDRELIGTYEGRWLRIEPHYVDGPAFVGLLGTTRGFGAFLQDQLRGKSVLFDTETQSLFFTQQHTRNRTLIPMTLAWHIGIDRNRPYYFKEGGGGGFRCMMRVYRYAQIATVIMANATGFDAGGVLDSVDRYFT